MSPSFPRFTATTVPRSSGLARATNIGALVRTSDIAKWQGLSAIGQAIQATSGLAFQAYQHRQDLDNKIESGKATQKIKDVASLIEKARSGFNPTIDQLLPDDPDYLEQGPTFNTDMRDGFDKEDANEFLKKTNKIISGIRSPEVQANIQSWRDENTLALLGPASSTNRRVLQDFHVTEIDKLRVSAAENGDIAIADYYADLMDDNQLITHGKAEALKKNNKIIAATSSVENIKPVLVAAITRSGNSEDGYKVLDAATAQLVKDGILTEPEAAEANKKLGDWIDNYVAGRIKAAKEADKLTTIQSYREMSKPILNGELTYDDIDNSGLRETRRSGESVSDAERWRKYIKGSYKDAPTKNAPEGHTVSFAAVYDVTTLQLSPKEGYDVLLEARFVDGSITNEQFEWAVDKIENPYQRHVLEDLNATLKSNLEDFNRLFASDNDRNKKVNEALISWADDLIKQDKVPSKKEMFAMSSAFRAGGGQPYDIGAVIERGGRQWEIVGFDADGEPLVEEIP
jgi:ribulose bisphosphate carboxylase small subunit